VIVPFCGRLRASEALRRFGRGLVRRKVAGDWRKYIKRKERDLSIEFSKNIGPSAGIRPSLGLSWSGQKAHE